MNISEQITGKERMLRVFSGQPVDRAPLLPVMHTCLPGLQGVSLRDYLTSSETMARVTVEGFRRFHLDGVQMTLGVTAEAQALGAPIEQPENALPHLQRFLLEDNLEEMNFPEAAGLEESGRLPLFFEAVRRVAGQIGGEGFVLGTLRGPMLLASQLRGEQQLLMDLLLEPEGAGRLLDFCAGIVERLGRWFLASGADGLVLGEAPCSPNFIAPDTYRQCVAPRHRRLIAALKSAGWKAVGLHICGDIRPIIPDILATGADFFDVDHAVSVKDANQMVQNRAVMRGNLDPAGALRFGTPDDVRSRMRALREETAGNRWILSSGCDIPPGAPDANLAAMAE